MSFVFLSLNNNSNSVKSLVVISLLSIVIVELFCRCIRHPNKCSPRCYDWKDCAVHCLHILILLPGGAPLFFVAIIFFFSPNDRLKNQKRHTGRFWFACRVFELGRPYINTKTNCRKVAFVCVILRQTPQNPVVFDKTPTEL